MDARPMGRDIPSMTIETPEPRTVTSTPSTVGRVEAIHLADVAAGPMRPVPRVRAIAGVGLEGDRYATGIGTYSPDPRTDRHLTLIEAEEIEALAERDGIVLAPGETRRNVTTRGIRLNELVGRRFRVGAVECEATRLCEPCQGLTDHIGKPVLKPLAHRAGLRALILTDGEIALGDEVVALD
jgi:MOSC domain-containing protein YiiM